MSFARAQFRVDATVNSGLGHVSRCLTLAKELKKFGIASSFVGPEFCEMAHQRIESSGFSHVSTTDEVLFAEHSKSSNEQLLVIDSYHINPEVISLLPNPIVVVDDFARVTRTQGVILNHNLGAQTFALQYTASKALLGAEFALIEAPTEKGASKTVLTPASRLLVTLGATLQLELTTQIVQAARQALPDAKVRLVGRGYESLASHHVHITTHSNGLSQFFEQCDAAVVGAGVTLLEVASYGIPAIAMVVADNQRPGAVQAEKQGLAHVVDATKLENLSTDIEKITLDGPYRQKMSQAQRKAVDGLGAERTAEAILRHFGVSL